MPKAKYYSIYRDLKEKIENDEYEYQGIFPSENTLVQEYDCSRNTIRRAVAELVADGYVQTSQGKGVRVIYQPRPQSQYSLGKIESFKEASLRNHQEVHTRVVLFTELLVDGHIADRTPFEVGTEIYYIQRVRYLDGMALIIDHNYFRKDIVPGLTPEIAEDSVYEYIEKKLGVTISNTTRMVTVERTTQLDERYLDLGDMNCVAVVSNTTYNSDGVIIEYTRSRHRPDHFVFYDQAQRSHGNSSL